MSLGKWIASLADCFDVSVALSELVKKSSIIIQSEFRLPAIFKGAFFKNRYENTFSKPPTKFILLSSANTPLKDEIVKLSSTSFKSKLALLNLGV